MERKELEVLLNEVISNITITKEIRELFIEKLNKTEEEVKEIIKESIIDTAFRNNYKKKDIAKMISNMKSNYSYKLTRIISEDEYKDICKEAEENAKKSKGHRKQKENIAKYIIERIEEKERNFILVVGEQGKMIYEAVYNTNFNNYSYARNYYSYVSEKETDFFKGISKKTGDVLGCKNNDVGKYNYPVFHENILAFISKSLNEEETNKYVEELTKQQIKEDEKRKRAEIQQTKERLLKKYK